jgi:hypothetical protein
MKAAHNSCTSSLAISKCRLDTTAVEGWPIKTKPEHTMNKMGSKSALLLQSQRAFNPWDIL